MLSEKSLIRESELKNFLLVEGKDDEHVFYSLLKHHQIPRRFEIKNKESPTTHLACLAGAARDSVRSGYHEPLSRCQCSPCSKTDGLDSPVI